VYGVAAALLLFIHATVEAFVVNILVAKSGINDQFASALLGTVLALAFILLRIEWKTGYGVPGCLSPPQ
jgi:hypothetical protein